jgi:hypothetical protein
MYPRPAKFLRDVAAAVMLICITYKICRKAGQVVLPLQFPYICPVCVVVAVTLVSYLRLY